MWGTEIEISELFRRCEHNMQVWTPMLRYTNLQMNSWHIDLHTSASCIRFSGYTAWFDIQTRPATRRSYQKKQSVSMQWQIGTSSLQSNGVAHKIQLVVMNNENPKWIVCSLAMFLVCSFPGMLCWTRIPPEWSGACSNDGPPDQERPSSECGPQLCLLQRTS